jgi:hypothetical protein
MAVKGSSVGTAPHSPELPISAERYVASFTLSLFEVKKK